MTNTNNTKPAIKPDQLAILQELSKLLDTPLKEIESLNVLEDYYSSLSVSYCISSDGDVIGLSVYGKEITNLEIDLIYKLKNLSHLYLNENQVQDISPLSRFSNLVSLSLYDNKIQDISPLSELINLQHLGLSNNKIHDITILTKLSNLTDLYLNYTHIRDISSLSKLINLRNLSLNYNYIQNISPLAGLVNLQYLYVGENNLISKDNLRYSKYLKKLKQLIYCDIPNWKEKKRYFKRIPLF
jgi:internalin A